MNKEVKYNGYSAQPSDYECLDGELAQSLNLINEDDSIHSIRQPRHLFKLDTNHQTVLFIHRTSTYCHLIVFDSNSNAIYYVNRNNLPKTCDKISLNEAQKFGILSSKPIDCVSLGNTLVITDSKGLSYFLWHEGNYRNIGSHPPFVSIEFGLLDYGYAAIENYTENVDTPTERSGSGGIVFSKIAYTNITNFIYGKLLPVFNDNVTKIGLFYMPFFVRYAYKLYDGTYSWHSAPILMLPTTIPLHCPVTSNIPNLPSDNTEFSFNCQTKRYKLCCRVLNNDIETLSLWKDIIDGIDVFVSAPIYTYNQNGTIPHNITTKLGTHAAALYRGNSAEEIENNPSENNQSSNNVTIYSDDSGMRPGQGGSSGSGNVRPGFTVPPEFGEIVGDNPTGSNNAPDSYFVGRVQGNDNIEDYHHETFHDVICNKNDSEKVFDIPINERFHQQVASCHDFYLISSLPLSIIKSEKSEFSPLHIPNPDLSNLTTRQRLSDDYDSHCSILPKYIHAYNGRLHLANCFVKPACPYPIRSVIPACGDDFYKDSYQKIEVTVYIQKNGMKLKAITPINEILMDKRFDAFFVKNLDTEFPRYIYYPDAGAYKMNIKSSAGHDINIDLEPHPHLNGAFYYGSFNVSPIPNSVVPETDQDVSFGLENGYKIYVSEVNNPFIFPVESILNFSSDIIVVSSATKALSQGQFGQFPLYAFTADGVWAIEVGSDGTYLAKQPISRDVCLGAESIAQLDTAVLFATNRGIMIISGSQTQCISDVINNVVTFNPLLPGIKQLHRMLGHSNDTCLPIIPFTKFIEDCRILYDYIHQRIIIYSPDYNYAYLYSLKSKLWGMMYSDINSHINSYPEAFANMKDGTLVNFSEDNNAPVPGLLITRPLKLDAVNIHKTIDNIIQRGNFRKGHVQSVLYGSRDLTNWHLVWSSKDHYLRGFRGTPYKYFCIALLCNLSPGESVFGASVQFTPRLTNQPR